MDWDKLRVFHAAAEAGSFTHAGEALRISQSAVSRQISALEEDLGVSLFHRHARGLLLTEHGENLFATTEDMAARLDAARERMTASKDSPAGTLKVTTTVALGSTWLAARVDEFVRQYPDIQLNLILDDAELDFAHREADVAIRLRQPTQADIIQRRLFIIHFHLYASQSYLDRNGAPEKVEDLDDHDIITYGSAAPKYLFSANWLESAGHANGQPDRKPIMKVNNILAIKRAVRLGIGIAMLPDYMVEKNSELIRIMPDAKLPTVDTYLAYPFELKSSAKVRAFCDFIVDKAHEWNF